MRVAMRHGFGPPHVLASAEVPDAVAGAGEVVVAVAFANITFVETQIRAGRPPNPAMLPRLPAVPAVPGNGVAEVVAAVGEGVGRALLGARVITATGGTGGYAERVAVPEQSLVPVPDTLALTAAADLGAGETVLVEAAAGGVGSLLVQLVKNAGCRVIAAAGTGQAGPRRRLPRPGLDGPGPCRGRRVPRPHPRGRGPGHRSLLVPDTGRGAPEAGASTHVTG